MRNASVHERVLLGVELDAEPLPFHVVALARGVAHDHLLHRVFEGLDQVAQSVRGYVLSASAHKALKRAVSWILSPKADFAVQHVVVRLGAVVGPLAHSLCPSDPHCIVGVAQILQVAPASSSFFTGLCALGLEFGGHAANRKAPRLRLSHRACGCSHVLLSGSGAAAARADACAHTRLTLTETCGALVGTRMGSTAS